jgi:RNA polymerase sigma-70 factor (ECF subfamily)
VPTSTTRRTGSAALAAGLARDLGAVFPDLVARHQDGIYSGVLRFVRDAGEAEDITQETFVRAYRALGGYEAERIEQLAVTSWLWTIALNLCRNAARTKSRRPVAVKLDAAGEAADPASTEADAVAAIESEAWRRRLEALSAPMRKAVVLRHVVGLSYAEISAAVDRPVGTVKADVHRGLNKLRRILTAEREEK